MTFEIERSCSLQTNWDARHVPPRGTPVGEQIHLVKDKQFHILKQIYPSSGHVSNMAVYYMYCGANKRRESEKSKPEMLI